MYMIERELKEFAAAHRLGKDYQGKCQHLHGHNYRVVVLLAGEQLDGYDFLIDFNDIKSLFDVWLQQNWDHCTLISEQDTGLLEFVKAEKNKYFLLPGGDNTTAEALARFLYGTFSALLQRSTLVDEQRVRLVEVKVFENVRSAAAYRVEA